MVDQIAVAGLLVTLVDTQHPWLLRCITKRIRCQAVDHHALNQAQIDRGGTSCESMRWRWLATYTGYVEAGSRERRGRSTGYWGKQLDFGDKSMCFAHTHTPSYCRHIQPRDY